MTPTQYRNAIAKLELTHARAAELLGVTERHEYRFASGESPVTPPVRKLLRLAIAGKFTLEELERA